jgi:hypothetical protein
MWSNVRSLWNFKSAAIPSQLRLNARPTCRRTVVSSYSPFYSVSKVDSAMLAPSIREQWYVILVHFCLRQTNRTGTTICRRNWGLYLDGKYPQFSSEVSLGHEVLLRAVNLLYESNGLKCLPEISFPEFFRP